MSTRRVRNEIQLWRMHWQQLDTLYDRVQGARDEDHPYAVRCKALYDAAVVLERLRLRRTGSWMPAPLAMGPGAGGVSAIATGIDDRKYQLPGPLEMEMALAGLKADEDGEVDTDTPKVVLPGSESLFEVWDDETKGFVPQYAPDYLFGRLDLGTGVEYEFIPGLFEPRSVELQIGADGTSRDSLFCVPRRKVAAAEGIVRLNSWSALRSQRMQQIEDDGAALDLAADQPEFTTLTDQIDAGRYAQAQALLDLAAAWARQDSVTLQAGIDLVEAEDPDDEAIAILERLKASMDREREVLLAAHGLLTGQVSSTERNQALALLNQLPDATAIEDHENLIHPLLDEAVEVRIAYPDGTLRALRTLELALLAGWRGKAPWFEQRRRLFLSPLLERFFRGFEDNLWLLVTRETTNLTASLVGVPLESATATNSDRLPLQPPASGQHDLKRLRPGQIAVLGGARPALAMILGHRQAPAGRQQLRILPLRVSLAQGLGLDGIPGLVEAGVPLGNHLGRPVSGDELRRGRRAGEPEGDAIPQQVVALWSRLKLLRGDAFTLTLPQPFAARLDLPVLVTPEQPLEAHAPQLLLPTAPRDDTTDPPTPLVGTPGEILLLRGRDADGLWWQGAVEVIGASVTTLEAQQASPERDPASPVCCAPETPVVLLNLSMNSMPVQLVDRVTLHRAFLGFGGPDLAVGTLLPARIDPLTRMLAARPQGDDFSFNTIPDGAPVDRTPELQAAVQILEPWLGEP